ncbi:hypothetical protein [Pseudomonas farris]
MSLALRLSGPESRVGAAVIVEISVGAAERGVGAAVVAVAIGTAESCVGAAVVVEIPIAAAERRRRR